MKTGDKVRLKGILDYYAHFNGAEGTIIEVLSNTKYKHSVVVLLDKPMFGAESLNFLPEEVEIIK